MKKFISLAIAIILAISSLTVSVSAHPDTVTTTHNFDKFSEGVFSASLPYEYINRTAYSTSATSYNDAWITSDASGNERLTLKSTKSAHYGVRMYNESSKNRKYTGTVEIGAKLVVENLNARVYFGQQDSFNTNAKALFFLHSNGIPYLSGTAYNSNRLNANNFNAPITFDMKFTVNLATGLSAATVKKNGQDWITKAATTVSVWKEISLDRLVLYLDQYVGTNGNPAAIHIDDVYVKPINRFYDTNSITYDFNDYIGNNEGTAIPSGFTKVDGYYTAKTEGGEYYEGIFAETTSRGTSVKAESNRQRTAETTGSKDAPYIIAAVPTVTSAATACLEFSVMRPEKSAAFYVTTGNYKKFLALVDRFGNLSVFDKDTGIDLSAKNKWYDVKIQFSTEDLTAFVEVYSGNKLVGKASIMQTDSTTRSYQNVRGTDVTSLCFGLYHRDTINPNVGDVSSIIFDDIAFGKTEDIYTPSDGYATFDIAYSSPITGTKVPAGNDVKVTFNNTIDEDTFTSSTITVNGTAVSAEQISFGEDNHSVILSDVALDAGKHYHVAFSAVADTSGNALTDYIEFDTKLPDYVLSDVKFSRGTGADEYVYAVTEPGVVNASFTALTNNGYTLDMLYYLALYKDNGNGGELVSLDSSNLKISGAEKEYKLSVTVPSDGSAYTVKAFRWSTKNIEPLCETAELRDINNQKAPLAIIKLDDMSADRLAYFEKWQKYAEDENIHLSMGVLCSSFDTEAELKSLAAIDASPNAEVWLHGYDHGSSPSEFYESKENQTQTFADCLKVANSAGITFKSFNPPYNELDTNTADLLEANGFKAVMVMTNSSTFESDKKFLFNKSFVTLYNPQKLETAAGTVSSLDTFITEYENLAASGKNCIVYQGHPAQWDAENESKFIEIVEYLKSIGTAFIEPADYARIMAQKK